MPVSGSGVAGRETGGVCFRTSTATSPSHDAKMTKMTARLIERVVGVLDAMPRFNCGGRPLPGGAAPVYSFRMVSAAVPTEFPIVRCATCARDVLGYLDLDEHDHEVTRCLECATIASADAVRFGDLPAIEAIGYGY